MDMFADEPTISMHENYRINLKHKLNELMINSPTLLIVIPTLSIVLSYFGTYVAKYPLFVVDYGNYEFMGIAVLRGGTPRSRPCRMWRHALTLEAMDAMK